MDSFGECPICCGHGIIKYNGVVYRKGTFKYEIKVDDCPLCDAYGIVGITEKDYVKGTRNTSEGDIHTGASPIVKELKGDWVFIFEEGGFVKHICQEGGEPPSSPPNAK